MIILNDLPSWKNAHRIGFDLETRDKQLTELGINPRRENTYIIGFSFAFDFNHKYYIPIRHEGGGNVNVERALHYLKSQLVNLRRDQVLVGANLSYDLAFLRHELGWIPQCKIHDVLMLDVLCNELHLEYSLDAVARRYKIGSKHEDQLISKALELMASLDKKTYGATLTRWRNYHTNKGISPKTGKKLPYPKAAVKTAKANMWRLHAADVTEYAEYDAYLPLALHKPISQSLDAQGLNDIARMETQLTPALVDISYRGIRADRARIDNYRDNALKQQALSLAYIKEQTGVALTRADLNLAEQKAAVLRALGFKVPRTKKTDQPSVTNGLLESLAHPVTTHLLEALKYEKMVSTFCTALDRYICNGRIHSEYIQMASTTDTGEKRGARFGRMSSANPNGQQYPKRSPMAKPFREIFCPDHGGIFCSNDFSSQEPRLMLHFAIQAGMTGATDMLQFFQDKRADVYKIAQGITHLERDVNKQIYLGLAYGMSSGTLCQRLDLPTVIIEKLSDGTEVVYDGDDPRGIEALTYFKELSEDNTPDGYFVYRAAGQQGQDMLDQFHAKQPFINELVQTCKYKARTDGFIRTLLGRKCRFPVVTKKTKYGLQTQFDWIYKSTNRLIQGSAGDMTKACTVAAYREGFPLQGVVHDEFTLTVENIKQAQQLAELMETTVKLNVPTNVDIELSQHSWGECIPLKDFK